MNAAKIFQLLPLVLLLGIFAICQAEEPAPVKVDTSVPAVPRDTTPMPDDDEIIASYGDEDLTLAKIKYVQPDPTPPMIIQFTDWWIDNQILADEAKRLKLGDDEKVKKKLRFRKELGVIQDYAELMKNNINSIVIDIADEEVKKYYDGQKMNDKLLFEPAQLSFTHITTASEEKAKELLEKVRKGENINALAKQFSKNRDAKKGGVVRKLQKNSVQIRFGKEFTDAFSSSSEGDFFGPVKSKKPGQWEIARHEGKVAKKSKPFSQVKDTIKAKLTSRAKGKAFKDAMLDLRKKASDKIEKSKKIFKE